MDEFEGLKFLNICFRGQIIQKKKCHLLYTCYVNYDIDNIQNIEQI